MALSITCSGCDAVYPVGEALIGKTIRCKKCGEMMPVTAPSKSKPAIALDDEEAAPRRPARARAEESDDDAPRRPMRRRDEEEEDEEVEAPKARSRRRSEDDDEDNDRPRRGRNRDEDAPKSKKPLLIAGLLALVLIGGGAGAAAMFGAFDGDGDDDKKSVAANVNGDGSPVSTTPLPAPNPTPSNAKTTPANTNTAKSTPPTPAPNPAPMPMTTPATTPMPTPTSAERNPPAPAPMPMTNDPGPSFSRGTGGTSRNPSGLTDAEYFNGNIPDLKMKQATRASVFIKCETDLGAGTGSGWFGVEDGIVFTNAHVLMMKSPNSPEPKKLTFFLNAGTPDQREIPHSKLKILAVDREIDLAVIQVIGTPDLPSPLKVKPSSELKLGQNVFTIGYPLGYTLSAVAGRSAKEPEVSARKTSYFGLASNEYGQPRRVKLESGANPGNSGGAVIDANAEVVGVVVEGTNGGSRSGNFITLCVPTEYVNGLVAGRVSTIDYGTPYRDKGKIRVPVTAQVLNPLKKTIEVKARAWIGDVNAKYRPPGGFRPTGEANDADESVVDLKFDPATNTAKGELVYNEAPTGRTYWVQPYYSNVFTSYSLPGIKVPMSGPPVERVPANLTSNPKQGSRRAVTLSNSSDLTESHEGEGESKDEKTKLTTTLKLNETVEKPDNTDQIQSAKLRLKFESINLGVEALGGAIREDIISKKNQEQLNALIKVAEAYGLLNRFGEMYKYTIGVRGVADPLFSFLVNTMAGDALEALQATSLPMPNRQVNPGETWTSTKDMRLYIISGPTTLTPDAGGKVAVKQPKPREFKYRDMVTYTYLGVRERNGRKEAVVQVEGKSIQAPGSKQTVTGSVKGLAWVEIDTGVVVEATITKEFEFDTSGEGVKKRVTGENEFKITRGAAQ